MAAVKEDDTIIKHGRIELQLLDTLFEERERQNLTQRELCRRTGLSKNHIYRIEGRYKSPLLSTFIKVVDALGLKIVLVRKD